MTMKFHWAGRRWFFWRAGWHINWIDFRRWQSHLQRDGRYWPTWQVSVFRWVVTSRAHKPCVR